MQMPSRKYQSVTLSSAEGYRYGFNGKEKDKDINSLTAYDYGFRIYNPAIGKFLSVDPLSICFPWYTPYQFAGNTPIQAIDLDGEEPKGYRWDNPYVQSHHGTGVMRIASDFDHEAYMISILGDPPRLYSVYAVNDIDGKFYKVYETATGDKKLWAIEYDKEGYKGDLNEFSWNKPPDPSNILTGITVLPLVVIPGALIYGPALIKYLAIEVGKEILEEAVGVPVFDGPIDAWKHYEKRKFAKEIIKDVADGHLDNIARSSVKKYGNFQCMDAADELVSSLKKEGFSGTILDITVEGGGGKWTNIWSKTENGIISLNGRHRGVLVDGKVYDNIHKNGISYDDWIKDFETIPGTTIKESRTNF